MRQSIRQFVEICVETLSLREPVCELGSFQVPGQEDTANLRDLFPDREYLGADRRGGPGVDIVADLHQLGFADERAGTVLILDTLEHVAFPQRALEEIHRVLHPQGTLILSSVLNFPIHNYPADYWRFTPEALHILLAPFAGRFVGSAGRSSFPHTVVAVAFKESVPIDALASLGSRFEDWKRRWRNPTGTELSLTRTALGFTPPAILEAYRKIRGTRS